MADPRIEYQHFQISPDAVLYLRAGNEANRNAQIMMWARQVIYMCIYIYAYIYIYIYAQKLPFMHTSTCLCIIPIQMSCATR